jgi:hypothetical protein
MITIPLSKLEDKVLTDLAERKGITKAALMRQALRLYQRIEHERAIGNTLAFLNERNEPMKQIIID